MKKKLSKSNHDELIEKTKEKFPNSDLLEILELLFFLTKEEIEDCLKYETYSAFVKCIKRKYDDSVTRENQLKK